MDPSLVQPYLEAWGQFLAPQFKKGLKLLKSIQRRDTRMVKGLEGCWGVYAGPGAGL